MIFNTPDGGQLMLLVANFSPSRLGIDLRPVDVGFVVSKLPMCRFFE